MAKPLTRVVVEQARDLIADPSQWCRTDQAQRRFRLPCSPFHAAARRYCAVGALYRAGFLLTLDQAAGKTLAHGAARALTGIDDGVLATRELVVVNDCYGHAAVLSVFDKMLERTSLLDQDVRPERQS